MKKLTEKRAYKIKSALHRQYQERYMDPTYDAQQNLSGISPWANPDTLRYFECRISNSQALEYGTLYFVESSISAAECPIDERKRLNVFDLLGNCVFEAKEKSKEKSRKAFEEWREAFDPLEHYKQALQSKINRMKIDAKEIAGAIR